MEPIAEVNLYCRDSSREDFVVTLGISAPRKNKHGEFETQVYMDNLEPSLHPIIGDTSFQSLCLALSFMKTLLASFIDKGGKVYFSKEEPIELSFSHDSKTNFSSLFGNAFDVMSNVEQSGSAPSGTGR